MKILFISTWFPFPLDNGSRLRLHYLLRALREKHQVHLAAFLPPSTAPGALEQARAVCSEVRVIERQPFWRDRRKNWRGYLSWKPRDVITGYSSEMARLVQSLVKENSYALVIASITEAAPYALNLPGLPRLLEEHNFMTAWMEQQYRQETRPLPKALRWFTWLKSLRYERWLYPHFQAVSMVSEHDRQAVKAAIPAYPGRLAVIPNGVDLESRQPGLAEPIPDTLVYNGALSYAANARAVHYFTQSVLPLIWQQRPQVKFFITGRYEGVDLHWLPPDPRIIKTGFLEDVRPAVASSWLAVAPLLDGGGTRLKILEAMALGVPVVATSKGAEGLAVIPNENIYLADQPQDFARACLRLLASRSLREEIAANAWRLVAQCYGWQTIGAQFCELVEKVAAEATELRCSVPTLYSTPLSRGREREL